MWHMWGIYLHHVLVSALQKKEPSRAFWRQVASRGTARKWKPLNANARNGSESKRRLPYPRGRLHSSLPCRNTSDQETES